MDVLKSLSDSDKARLIELLLSDTTNQNEADNTLNNIKRYLVDKSPQKNSPSPQKKQKTLDGWLIKRNDTSKKLPDQPTCHAATKSDFDKVSESEKETEETNTGNLTSKNSGNCNEDSILPSTSRLLEKSSMNDDVSPCFSKETETNNLYSENCAIRSKRKAPQPSPGLDNDKTPKRIKSACEKLDNLHINDGKKIERNKSTDHNCTSESENIDKKGSTGNDNLTTKKNSYNLRTKTKKSKLLEVDLASNNKLTEENNQGDVNKININQRSNNNALESKYEAFCKLNQICKEMSINVLEILRDKNVTSMINDPKILSNDAIVFIGSLKLHSGNTSPVVHLAKSKKKLLEHLVSMQEKLSEHKTT